MAIKLWITNDQKTAPGVKAAVRDLKAYRNARGYRPIPLVFVVLPYKQTRTELAEYLGCGGDAESIDVFALEVMGWCDPDVFYGGSLSYDTILDDFKDYHLPVIFRSTCHAALDEPPEFANFRTMLSQRFAETFSGVAMEQWFGSDLSGLVKYPENEEEAQSRETRSSYEFLSSVLSTITISGTARDRYTPSVTAIECEESVYYRVGSKDLPTLRGLNFDSITRLGTWTIEATTSTGPGSSRTNPPDNSDTSSTANRDDPDEDEDNRGGQPVNTTGIAIGGSLCAWSCGVVFNPKEEEAKGSSSCVRNSRNQRGPRWRRQECDADARIGI